MTFLLYYKDNTFIQIIFKRKLLAVAFAEG